MREARDLVFNVINCSKPIVSAMHGPAVGAGLVAALLADVSVVGPHRPDHRRPHPPRCGRRRPRRDLLAAAVRHGQGQVPPPDLRPADGRGGRAHRPGVAVRGRRPGAGAGPGRGRPAGRQGAQTAIRWTKHTLNDWYRAQSGVFDASLAYEFIGFGGPDAPRGPGVTHGAARAELQRPAGSSRGRRPAAGGRAAAGPGGSSAGGRGPRPSWVRLPTCCVGRTRPSCRRAPAVRRAGRAS